MISKCPGSMGFSQPHPEFIKCPYCSSEVEIFTDEAKAVCPKCKKEVLREGAQRIQVHAQRFFPDKKA